MPNVCTYKGQEMTIDVTTPEGRTELRRFVDEDSQIIVLMFNTLPTLLDVIEKLEQQVTAITAECELWARRRSESLYYIDELERDNEHLRWLLDQEIGPQGDEA